MKRQSSAPAKTAVLSASTADGMIAITQRITDNTLRVDELRQMSADELVTLWQTPYGVTTILHELMLSAADRLIRTAIEIIGANRKAYYLVRDGNGNTPLHAFAMRVGGAHNTALCAFVIGCVPLDALSAVNKENNTPVHLFPLTGNYAAVKMCRERDASLGTKQNVYMQTPTELSLERQRSETEQQLRVTKEENRRLAHNQSMADEEEEKLKEFYRRMDDEMKRRDAVEATLREAAASANKRIEGLEAIRTTQARVMRDALAEKEAARNQADELRRQLDEATSTQTQNSNALAQHAAELQRRERELHERSSALDAAYNEIEALRAEENAAIGDEHQRKIQDAEKRAAELQARVSEETRQRDEAATNLRDQQRATDEARTELLEMRQRVKKLESKEQHAAGNATLAQNALESMRTELETMRREEAERRETQLQALREENEHARAELQTLKSSSEEAQRLRASLDAERDRNEQWRSAAAENEQKMQTLLAELETERAKPIVVSAPPSPSLTSSQLIRRASAKRLVPGGLAAAMLASGNDDAPMMSPRTRSTTSTTESRPSVGTPRASSSSNDEANAGLNGKFFNNVINCVLDGDIQTLTVLVSPKLELNVDVVVDAMGRSLLEILLFKTVQHHHILVVAAKNRVKLNAAVPNVAETQYARAADMFELLVRAGARWPDLPEFITEHREHVPPSLAMKFDVYEQWWPFVEVLLGGEKSKETYQQLQRLLPTLGDPNHILSSFASKAIREQFVGRNMTYLHIALELYTEQVVGVVTLLLSVPEIDVRLLNSHGMTPLHSAIHRLHTLPHKCVPIVEALMAAGSNASLPCINAEMLTHWTALASKAAKQNEDKQTKREAGEASVRAKILQRTTSKRASMGKRLSMTVSAASAGNSSSSSSSSPGAEELTALHNDACKYTTPLAMAEIVGNARLIELLTSPRYRRIDTADLAEMIIERALMHDSLLTSFRSGQLRRHPLLVRYFEALHHVLHCYNPYTTSVIKATGIRPTVLKTKLATALPQTIVDNDERLACALVNEQVADSTSPLLPAVQTSLNAPLALEQLITDIGETRECASVLELAQQMLRVAKASESHQYDVSDTILKSAVERFDEAVQMAIAMMIERNSPPQAFVYVVARDDAQYGPLICYDTPLPTLEQRSVLQALVVAGQVEQLEALYLRSPDVLEHRFLHDQALLKLAIDSKQPLILAAIDCICQQAAHARRVAFEARNTPNALSDESLSLAARSALMREQKRAQQTYQEKFLDAKLCQAANRDHYLLLTGDGSTILHLCVEQFRDDLLQFVLSSVMQQIMLCDVHGRKPLETATKLALDASLLPTQREALTRCVSLLRTAMQPVITPLNFATLKSNDVASSTPKTITPTVTAPLSAVSQLSPRKETIQDDDDDNNNVTTTTTPRRRRHRERQATAIMVLPTVVESWDTAVLADISTDSLLPISAKPEDPNSVEQAGNEALSKSARRRHHKHSSDKPDTPRSSLKRSKERESKTET